MHGAAENLDTPAAQKVRMEVFHTSATVRKAFDTALLDVLFWDPSATLKGLLLVHGWLDDVIIDLIRAGRLLDPPLSWERIGQAAGVSAKEAQDRWADRVAVRNALFSQDDQDGAQDSAQDDAETTTDVGQDPSQDPSEAA